MRLATRQECVRSLPGWRKGIRQKKTETHWKIVKSSRKAYRELGWSLGKPSSPRFSDRRRSVNRPYPGLRAIEPPRSTSELPGLVFTQRRSVVDIGMPPEGGLGSRRRSLVPNHYEIYEFFPCFRCL
ncbi:hypothetical protein B296_00029263 [Ensete ventricosum]|uniref:Uncharacterized protein n=1 Tax=Ensete ventricosum TaxID=4639 RepID=A0A426XQX6_ENSVE|nr:hypothetical protein B296_00029263 [Ensete ventricosum]